MLNLQLVRGPLPSEADYRTIHAEYTRLTQARVSERLMHRWCKDSPSGPALHALLRTDEGKIVGHMCIIPFPIQVGRRRVTGGKTEYLFVHEDYRRERVRGMEPSRVHAGILMLQQIYRHASQELGWDPILASTIAGVDRMQQAVGCRPLDLAVFECLLIRRPWNAYRFTPNLSPIRRLALLFLGLPQTCLWALLRVLLVRVGRHIRPVAMDASIPSLGGLDKAHFSSAPDYLSWRYPPEGFQRLGFADRPDYYVTVQNGSPRNYLRICQSNLNSLDFPVLSLIVELMGQARSCHAIGVRWALYDNGSPPTALVHKLRRLGFLCVRRQRKILVYTRDKALADPTGWSFDDSLVSFELV